jgi:hypothetical protein
MNWLNLNITVLDSEEFLGAEPVQRATWLCLLRYCIGQENGGRIKGAMPWTDRKWQQVVRVTAEEVAAGCDLWSWDGEDLVVRFYPNDKEHEVQTNRANGSKGGRPRKATPEPKPEPVAEPRKNHPVSDGLTGRFEIAETERKGIGSGKEGEGNGNGNEAPSPARVFASRVEPVVDDCVLHAQQHLRTNPGFAASVGRQFHALFARKNWRTCSGEDLLSGAAWKHRLNQMLEEEVRKDPAKHSHAAASARSHSEGRGW